LVGIETLFDYRVNAALRQEKFGLQTANCDAARQKPTPGRKFAPGKASKWVK